MFFWCFDIFKPWNMGDQRYRPKGGRFVDYWTFIPKDFNEDERSKQVSIPPLDFTPGMIKTNYNNPPNMPKCQHS